MGGFFIEQMEEAMTLRELQEKRERLVAEARERLNQITDDTDDARRAELEAQHDAAIAELDKLDAEINRRLRLEEAERRGSEFEERMNRGDSRRPRGNGEAGGVDDGDGGAPSYRDAFHAMLRSNMQMGDPLTAEQRAVLRAGYQQVENRAQTTTNAEGGYTVPEEMMSVIIRSMAAWGPMYDEDVATVLTTVGGGRMTMPTVNDTAVTAGAAPAEGTTLTDDGGKDVTFGERTLDAYSFDTEWIRVSLELAQDSIFAMEALLGDLLGERLGRIANLQLTTGTGSNAPNGIVTASSLGKTAAATNAITWNEIFDLEHSVDPAYRVGPKVRYMFNDSMLLAMRKLTDGDGNYLWQAGNVQAGIPSTFNGRPYSVNQAMESLAAAKKVMLFGDFSKYYVRKVGQPLIGAISDKDFWPGFGVAGYVRFDGELGDTAAVKHLITAAS